MAGTKKKPSSKSAALAVRSETAVVRDGYIDDLTSSGRVSEKMRPIYGAERELGHDELSNAYENDAVAARIVDQVVDDAIRADWKLVGLDVPYDWQAVKSRIDDLKALPMIGNAWRWARLQRGALLVLAVDDGQKYDKPLDLSKVRSLNGLSVVDASRAVGNGHDYKNGSSWRENPEFYELQDPDSPDQKKVHRSRVIRFDGVRVTPDRMRYNGTWGPSVLSRCWRSLANYSNVMLHAEQIMRRISVMVLRMKGWKKAACGTGVDRDNLRAALREMWWGMDNLNLLALDMEDEFGEVKRSIEGVSAMISAAVDDLVMTSGTTRQVITGTQTSTGLNSDTKGERHAWFDHVTVQRRIHVSPALTRILEIEFAAMKKQGKPVPAQWTLEYEPLEQEAQDAHADRAAKWGNVVAQLINLGVIKKSEGRTILVNEKVIAASDLEKEVETAGASQRPTGLTGVVLTALADILSKVTLGELAPNAATWLMRQAAPDAPLEEIQAAVASALADRINAPAAPGEAAPTAVGDPGSAIDDLEEEEPEDEVSLAWSTSAPPGDATEARAIARELGIPTVRITRAHREGRIQGWTIFGGKPRYSLREVRALILAENGSAPEAPVAAEPSPED